MKRSRACLAAMLCALLLVKLCCGDAGALLHRLQWSAAVWELGGGWQTPPAGENVPLPEENAPSGENGQSEGAKGPKEEKAAPTPEENASVLPEEPSPEAETPPAEPRPAPEAPAEAAAPPLPEAELLTAEGKTLPAPSSEPKALRFGSELITNRTTLRVDPAALLREPLALKLKGDSPQILIIHTHGTEAYTPSPGCEYESSDPYRTTDRERNVVRVGDELTRALSSKGLRVIHDRELYDYPSYTGSYNRSGNAVEDWLSRFPDLAVVIDLHRDALGEGDTVYKTRAEISGEAASQVMLLVGTGENGLEHPHWQENFKLALRLQEAMRSGAPTLCRPIDLVSERYNQHLTKGSLILEVGSSGNTLPEALAAVRLFADVAAPVLLSLVENGG